MPINYPKNIVQQPLDANPDQAKYPFPALNGLDKPDVAKLPKKPTTVSLGTKSTDDDSTQVASSSPLYGVTRLSVVVGKGNSAIASQSFNNGKGVMTKPGKYLDEVDMSQVFCFAPGVDKPRVCWKARNTHLFTKVKFELFCKNRVNPIWTRTWNTSTGANIIREPRTAGSKIKGGVPVDINWTGSIGLNSWIKIDPALKINPTDLAPAFPDGILTVEHSPYQLRMTINDGIPDKDGNGYPLIAWTYIHVLVGSINLDWFPNPNAVLPVNALLDQGVNTSLKDVTDNDNLSGRFPAPTETKKVYLNSNIFYRTISELEDNTFYDRYKTKWGNGPKIPILAKIQIRKTDGTLATADNSAKAVGRVKLFWDFEDQGGDVSNITDNNINTFVSDSYLYSRAQDAAHSPAGKNCHVDRGGKRGENAQPVFPTQVIGGANLFPFTVTPSTAFATHKWTGFSETHATGAYAGQSGVIFQPSRMAGDGYQLHVYYAYDTDQQVINTATPTNVPANIHTTTGIFQIWREINIASSLRHGNNLSPAIDLDKADGGGIEDFVKRRLKTTKSYDNTYIGELKVEFTDLAYSFELSFPNPTIGNRPVDLTPAHKQTLKTEYDTQFLTADLTSTINIKIISPAPVNDRRRERANNVIAELETIHQAFWATRLNRYETPFSIQAKLKQAFLRIVQANPTQTVDNTWLTTWYQELTNVCQNLAFGLEDYVQNAVDYNSRTSLITFRDYNTWRNQLLAIKGNTEASLLNWADTVTNRLDNQGQPTIQYWYGLAGETPLMRPWNLVVTLNNTQTDAGRVLITFSDLANTAEGRSVELQFPATNTTVTPIHRQTLKDSYNNKLAEILSAVHGSNNIIPYPAGATAINIEVNGPDDSPNRITRRNNVKQAMEEIHAEIWRDESQKVYENKTTGSAWAFVIAELVYNRLPPAPEGLAIFHSNNLHNQFSTLVGKSLLANAAGDRSGFWLLENYGRQDTWEHEIGHCLFLSHTNARISENPRELNQTPAPANNNSLIYTMHFTNTNSGERDGRGINCTFDGLEMLRIRGWSIYKTDQLGVVQPPTGGLTILTVTNPANGTAVISGGGNTITYTPNNNYAGDDNFKYAIQDNDNISIVIAVVVKVVAGAAIATTYKSITTTVNNAATITVINAGRHPAFTGVRSLWKQSTSNKSPAGTPPPAWLPSWSTVPEKHPIL